MYHPTRGGVRGGRDQFKWDDVKVDKHRENYLGHSLKAPVGRWQKGKDLFWYTKDKNSQGLEQDALKAEIQRIKEEEEQSMREALGLAPKRSDRPKGNRLDKHEFSELVKRGSTAEDLEGGHAEAAKVQGLGFARAPCIMEASTTVLPGAKDAVAEMDKALPEASEKLDKQESDEEGRRKKRKHDERKREKHEERKHRRREKHEKHHSHDSNDKRKRRKEEKKKRRNDSDSE
ncbi:multiple myeloma tumor-associated protein 2 homolog [Chenopodium quinoa]|uniref:Multiple myeloma tumor-associated protein 2-like N-terminal domain-containing protein n=1 Tax=Chenopodium quinoa TaxID=63459 RepID=A0A803N711_CHEQI|nr:multiple myeloma tumor-associated protein 2 homolog [Chenopodium quinoa]